MFKFFGEGRLVADPEVQEIKTDGERTTCVARFTLATNEYRKVNDEKITYTSFVDCEAWDSGAKTLSEICGKGDLVFVTGRVRQNKWKTEDGHNRSRIIFRVEEFSIAKKANKNSDDDNEQSQ